MLFVVWALFMILAMSNGVNLTDGLDGLATGASVMVFGAYTFIGVWQFQAVLRQRGTLTNPTPATRSATRSTSRWSPPR